MVVYDIKCPLCPGMGAIEIRKSWAVFKVEGYESDPTRRISRLEPRPQEVMGEKAFVEGSDYRRVEVSCTNDHHLRISATHYKNLTADDCLYGPDDTPDVRCPQCEFRFGSHETFTHSNSLSEDNHMILRSVSTEPRQGHEEVQNLTRRDCVDYSRVSERKQCPHCGDLVYLNYRSLAFDSEPQYVGAYESSGTY